GRRAAQGPAPQSGGGGEHHSDDDGRGAGGLQSAAAVEGEARRDGDARAGAGRVDRGSDVPSEEAGHGGGGQRRRAPGGGGSDGPDRRVQRGAAGVLGHH